MSRETLSLTALLFVSYGALLWLTAPDRSDDLVQATQTAVAEPQPQLASAEVQEPATDKVLIAEAIDLRDFEDEQLNDELPLRADEVPEEVAPTPAFVEPARSPESETIRQLAYTSTPQAIETLTRALRSAGDRDTRLMAVNSLLLMGRRSSVDPAITQALKDASADKDQIVAANANAALSEVQRETH